MITENIICYVISFFYGFFISEFSKFPIQFNNSRQLKMKLIILLLYFVSCHVANSEIFSAIEELENLTTNQEVVIGETEWFITEMEKNIVKLKENLVRRKTEHDQMKQNTVDYVLNPLNAYLLIKSLSADVSQMKKDFKELTYEFDKRTEKARLSFSDFEGAIDGLIRLQETYTLDSAELANGIINGKKFREKLSANDLFMIGLRLIYYSQIKPKLAREYLELAFERNQETKEMSNIVILQSIIAYYNKSSIHEKVLETIERILKYDPGNQMYENMKVDVELKMIFDENPKSDDEEEEEEPRNGSWSQRKEFLYFSKSCSGIWTQTIQELSKLHCRYGSNSLFSKIAPFKIEEANLDPYIVLYHDVISDFEIDVLKKLSRPEFKRAEVMKMNASRVASLRVAKVAWHSDMVHPVLRKLSLRTEDMTGLHLKSAEQWQVQNYGIGGHYAPHYDFTTKEEQPFSLGLGNRIATALFYVNEF